MISSCVWADTECFVVTRLGYRWALTLAPPYVQLIWTRMDFQTCWLEHPCFLRSGMRVKSQSISTEEMWVCKVDEHVERVGQPSCGLPRNLVSYIHGMCMCVFPTKHEARQKSSGTMVFFSFFTNSGVSSWSWKCYESFEEAWENFWFYVETWWYWWISMLLMSKPTENQLLWPELFFVFWMVVQTHNSKQNTRDLRIHVKRN